MNLAAAIIGTSFYNPGYTPPPGPIDLGAGYGEPANMVSGALLRREYVNYHGDDMTFFAADNAVNSYGDTLVTVDDNTTVNGSQDYFSVMWTGYLYAPSGGQYQMQTSSDDGSYLWIGDNAINNWTTSTANVNNGGAHGSQTVGNQVDVLMTGGRWYPVRMVFGEIGGGAFFSSAFQIAGSPITPVFAYNGLTADGF